MISFGAKTEKHSLFVSAVSMGLVILILVSALLYLIFGSTMGWFASNDSVEADGLQVAVKTPGYDLLVDRENEEYHQLLNGEEKYTGATLFRQTLEASPFVYDFVADSTSTSPKLAFELHNEAPFTDDGVEWYFLMPGAYGSMTFYVRPYYDEPMVMDMQLELAAFGEYYDENNELKIREVESTTVRNLLRGHVMFFMSRTGNSHETYKYDGLLTDSGVFTFDTSHWEKSTKQGRTDCYEITLYWEWPLTYYDIAEEISDALTVRRFPAEVGEYIEAEPGCFFATNIGSNDIEDLSDGYNDGDQMIGENATFFAAFITPV